MNEEGLPIIEITEPLPNSDFPTLKEQSVTIEGPNLVPLASLTQSERDHLRAERDRILDFLEKQEKEDQRKEEEREQNEIREDVQRRKAAVKFEPDKLKAAKEMQKKMGKALLKSMESDRQKQEKIQEEVSTGEPSQGPPVKRVRFAKERTENVDWGDVTPATLEPMNKNTLITKSRMQKNQVMKDVVERLPPGVFASQGKVVDQGDSDDESNPDSAVPSYSDDDSVIQPLDNNEDLGSNSSVDKESESFDLEEEYDMDVARHQREIALEYYEKRGIIGKNVSKSLESTTVCPVPFLKFMLFSYFFLQSRRKCSTLPCLRLSPNHQFLASKQTVLPQRTTHLYRQSCPLSPQILPVTRFKWESSTEISLLVEIVMLVGVKMKP